MDNREWWREHLTEKSKDEFLTYKETTILNLLEMLDAKDAKLERLKCCGNCYWWKTIDCPEESVLSRTDKCEKWEQNK